mgnify:CR=1 FL=1
MNEFTEQRETLCATCPFARRTTKEYLDTRGDNGTRFLAQAHMNAILPCHCDDEGFATVGVGRQCAGAAKFRANVGVTDLAPQLGTLPADTETVFATDAELLAHHKGWTIEQAEEFLQDNVLDRLVRHEWMVAQAKQRVIRRPRSDDE